MSLAQAPSGGRAVSVIVPTFNRERFIAECIENLLALVISPKEGVVFSPQWRGDDGLGGRNASDRANASLPSERAEECLLHLQLDHHNGPRAAVALGW